MNNNKLADLLDKYSKGTCTPEEIAIIHKWYNQYQKDDDILDSFSDRQRELMKATILNSILSNLKEERPLIKPLYSKLWFKFAAAAILIVLLKIGFNGFFSTGIPHGQGTQIRIVNNTGNIVKKVLPDNSIVWLNPNAIIEYPRQFANKSRDLVMDGECFFEITKNPEQPFIIHSKRLVTKVWGTKFMIVDSDKASAAEVAVMSGKVSVSIQGSEASRAGARLTEGEVVLGGEQKALLEAKSKRLNASRSADVSSLKIYEHVDLVFDNAKLSDIVSHLNEQFDTNISIKDKELRNKVLNADLTNLNLPEILEVLKTSLHLNYEMKDSQITIMANK